MDTSPSSLCLPQISPAGDRWKHVLHQFEAGVVYTSKPINFFNQKEQNSTPRETGEDIPDVLAQLCDYVAVIVKAHEQELFSQPHASHAHASPMPLLQSQAAVSTIGFAQRGVVNGDAAAGDFAVLVAQPQD